ncbi:MAG: WXG100 family type VII secretion target [Actinomycetaceae bacterium]|nr:WXG100 family type VII secretion target [Actinomycetaceae bacterium]
MSDINLNYATIAAVQEQIGNKSRNISQQLEDMENTLAPLSQQWSGEASGAYQKAKAQWNAAITDMNQVLVQIRALLGDTAQDFNATDRQGAARFGG